MGATPSPLDVPLELMDSWKGTAEQANFESRRVASGISQNLLGYRQSAQVPRSADGRSTPRKPTPSPLQVSEAATAATVGETHSNIRSPKSPTAFQSNSLSESSPRSPRPDLAANLEQPKSPPERLNELLASENVTTNGDTSGIENRASRATIAAPSKAQSYSQLRNVSSPFPQLRPLGNSSPPSPRSTASPPLGEALAPLEVRPMPRTSSIDSAISKHSHKTSLDTSSASDISDLIETAGSPEAVIQHLLKEKQSSAVQNAQLWKIVDKQRSLVLGLNQDLEKALRDKEKYRKELKGHLDKVPPIPSMTHKAPMPRPRDASHSPAPSEASADLPIQRQSLVYAIPRDSEGGESPTGTLIDGKDQNQDRDQNQKQSLSSTPAVSEEADDWVRSKPRAGGSNHSHKATSSSDLGVLGPVKAAHVVTPVQTNDLEPSAQKDTPNSPTPISQAVRPVVSPTNSFTAKRSQPFFAKAFNGPTLALIESTPPGNDIERTTPPRKPPPAPLHLGQPKPDEPAQHHFRSDDHSGSDYDENMEVDELPALDRGRKKTREADDKEREAAMLKEKQDRSRSKKEKGSKPPADVAKPVARENVNPAQRHGTPIPASIKTISREPTATGTTEYLSPPASLAGVLSPSGGLKGPITTERLMTLKPMSPGLPLSPRPNHRPMNPPTPRMPRDVVGTSLGSPPMSPRNAFSGLPLSPRVSRQPIPLPPNTSMSLASPKPANFESRNDSNGPTRVPSSPVKNSLSCLQTHVAPEAEEASKHRGIFKGFMSDAYPELLIPPNALPSIIVKVVSSRLKPSRHSLVLKGTDEEPVFTLGISARSDCQELWQVERPIQSLLQLDQQLRQSTTFNAKLPDRSLFTGHAPAKIDGRRVALEQYFENILDTQMDEKAALALCYYLSTQAAEPTFGEANSFASAPHPGSPVTQGIEGRLLKEGYLTKKGKNFGGWKARFFVLEEPVLRYYETPGGSVLGTIKLQSAHIGKQSSSKPSYSPSRGPDDNDGHYRHAFLIREPKRKDKDSFMDHVLCAESDAERDSWVAALLHYVDGPEMDGKSRPPLFNSDSGSSRVVVPSKKSSLKTDVISSDSPNSEKFDSLQAVPYEDTKPAQAPHVLITPDPLATESPSPTTSSSQPSVKTHTSQSKAISAPSNGAKINDVGAWGNKPMAVPVGTQREHKKRSIWGFRDKNGPDLGLNHPNDSNLSLTQQQYQEQITNVKAAFGAPLADAVEYCGPRGIDVCLPAVVYRCLEYLESKDAPSEEGIFRMSGSNVVIKGLKKRFNAEGDFDFLGPDEPYFDVHAVASLLKLYLRELPQPVLTRDLHLEFIAVLDLTEKPKKIAAYNVLVHRLPKPNFTLLRALSAFLINIINNSEINKMTMRNVGIVFSPTLNIPTPVLSMFLTEFDAVFREKIEAANVPSLEVTTSEPLTPEDIRSPRRQMFSDIPTPSYTQDTFSASNSQLSHPYEQAPNSHTMDPGDTGFIPLQPAYEISTSHVQQGSVTVPGPEYAVARPRNLPAGGAAKARRRESSMLLMSPGQRKSSLPVMSGDNEMLHEENAFD